MNIISRTRHMDVRKLFIRELKEEHPKHHLGAYEGERE
jgi:hypothetical protein